MTGIKVPPLGESVAEATVAKWLKGEGDYVEADEPLAELETDKVTVEVNAPESGVLAKISVPVGESVEVGSVIGELTPGKGAPEKKTGGKKKSPEKEAAKTVERPPQEKGVPAPSKAEPAARPEERVRMTRLRQRVAQRLKDAQNTAAILTTFNEIDMGAVMDLRAEYKEAFEKKHEVKLGFMSFFIRASVQALKEFPAVNAEIDGDEIVYRNYYNISVAVSTPQGLVVPVINDADGKSMAELERELAGLGERAREGKLAMEELQGGTFTITNGGVFGSLLSTPILNSPQSGILGMHKIEQRPVVMPGGAIEARPMMYVALSYDHRIIDGREAVSFLVRVKEDIENPQKMLLDL